MNVSVFLSVVLLSLTSFTGAAQEKKPALVVGIVVDQMRYDYITRYWDLYGENGFRRLVREGYNFSNAHYDYVPTYTGAGHAHIATGAYPSINGIIGNEWYDRRENKLVYCAEDKTVKTIGSTSNAGLMSPVRLLSTTVGDELRLSSNFKSKVFGVALKDRGAILSTGRAADCAYWFDDLTGNFITSSYYRNDLPQWVNQFNDKQLAKKYLTQIWKPSISEEQFLKVSTEDNNPFEGKYRGVDKPVFPYDLNKIAKNYKGDLIRSVPFGNTLTLDFAKALIAAEGLGKDLSTDLLMISLSTPDYMGHQFGPRSREVADMYIRLDKEIADLIQLLNSSLPDKNYIIFLTADHGAADNPQFLNEHKLNGGNFDKSAVANLRRKLSETFGEDLILAYENLQIYLDHNKINSKKIDRQQVIAYCVDFLQSLEPIAKAIPGTVLNYSTSTDQLIQRYSRGYHSRRSGDIALVLDPGYIDMSWQTTGTTHGSGYSYDTHVPIIFYGLGIPQGESSEKISVGDIAPTLSSMLKIAFPNGSHNNNVLHFK